MLHWDTRPHDAGAAPWLGLSNADILALVSEHSGATVGIDAPFGWPSPFRAALEGWAAHGVWRSMELRALRYRQTDLSVHAAIGRLPLSVSTDLISVVAMRCAALLSEMADGGLVHRVGGAAAEVYPSATLRRWELDPTGYKRPDAQGAVRREALAADIRDRGGLSLSAATLTAVVGSDHCLDALICALAARARDLGLTTPPTDLPEELVAEEGWIELPVAGSLEQLAGVRD